MADEVSKALGAQLHDGLYRDGGDVQAAFEEEILLLLEERDSLLQAKDDTLWRLALAIQWANQFWIGNTQFTQYVEDAFVKVLLPDAK